MISILLLLLQQPDKQFDLHCIGWERTTFQNTDHSERKVIRNLKIDLINGDWCEEDCKVKMRIASNNGYYFQLREERREAGWHKTDYFYIDKMYYQSFFEEPRDGGILVHRAEMKCEKAAYSGIPG